jgi:hypothetical protein
MEDRTLLSTFLVSDTADSGPGSLRQAILNSNAATGTTNTIDFDIAGSGVQTISPLSAVPAIVNPVLIDGFSQPGSGGTPLIQIAGKKIRSGDGLLITGADVTIRGLDIGSFSKGAGIHLTGAGATGDWIYGSFLGTDPTGTKAQPDDYGVEIDAGASGNLIGTNGDGVNDTTERNLLSGNLFAGVWITGQGTDGNVVAGNFMGTDHWGPRPWTTPPCRSAIPWEPPSAAAWQSPPAPRAIGSAPTATASMTSVSATSSRGAITTPSTSTAPGPTATSSRATSSGPT